MSLQRLCITVMLLSTLLAAPLHAQLVPYDDFAADRIDPSRWRVHAMGAASTTYEVTREIANGTLLQGLRTYGVPVDDGGAQAGSMAVSFAQGGFTAVQWDTTVHGYQLQGCPTPGAQPSALQVDLRMLLFNDGSRLTPEDATGTVDVRVRLVRRSDSADPPEVVQAIGLMTRCTAPDCATREHLGEVSLGPVLVGQPSTFLMVWDVFHARVDFHHQGVPVASIPYTHPTSVPLGGGRTWQVVAIGAHCTAAPRPFAEVRASLDNVLVFLP